MVKMIVRYLSLLLLLCQLNAFALTQDTYTFSSKQQQQQFQSLLTQLRCLVCQNEDLADSNAKIAKDLRDEIYQMVNAGIPNPQIIKYLESRYGSFILFKPPLTLLTILLWFTPFIVLSLTLAVLLIGINKRSKLSVAPLSQREQQTAERLLKD